MKQSWLRPLSMALFLLLPSMYAASAYAVATLTASPMSRNFGYQPIGTTVDQEVVIKNTSKTTTVTGIVIVLTGNYGITILTPSLCNTFSPFALAANSTCKVKVSFNPKKLGIHSGNLNVTSDNADNINVTFTGTGNALGGAWNAGAPINAKRIYHTATKLADGKVLIVGGYNELGSVVVDEVVHGVDIRSVELYDLYDPPLIPIEVGKLTTPRGYHTATLLPKNCGNQVLVVGGVDKDNAVIGTAELYDPDQEEPEAIWSSAGIMSKARYSHTATLLPGTGCKVLITGGIDAAGNYVSTSEIYTMTLDTTTTPHTWTGTWSSTGNLNIGRSWHTATLLANGKVLVTGGNGNNAVDFLRDSELYDPTKGTWTRTGNLVTGRNSHTATLLDNNKVLVVGGYNDSKGGSLNFVETYDSATGLWKPATALGTKRNQHTETLLHNGEVLIAGGLNENNVDRTSVALNEAEVYNPSVDAWRKVGVPMTAARFGHTAILLDIIEFVSDVKQVSGKVYVVGGSSNDDISGTLNTSELYSPVAVTLKATEIKFDGTAATPTKPAIPTTGVTATLNGRVTTKNTNVPTTVSFDYYGLTTSYRGNIYAATIPVGKTDEPVKATTPSLPCGFEYHYRLKTVSEVIIYGGDQTFKTLPCKTTDLKIQLTDNKTVLEVSDNNITNTTTYVATITNTGAAFDVVANAIFKAPIVGNLTATRVTCTAVANSGAKCPTIADTTVGLLQGTGIIIPRLPKSNVAKLTFNIKTQVAITAPNGELITYGASITAPKEAFVDQNLSTNTARDSNRIVNPLRFPDLVITGITVTPVSPKINTVFSAVVMVKNVGTKSIAIADGVFLDVWGDRAAPITGCNADGDAYRSLGILAAGASKPLTVSMTASPIAGAKVLRAYIDSTCGVIEFYEDNNQTSKNYTVSP